MPGKSGWRMGLAHPKVKGGESRAKDREPWRQGKRLGALRAGGWGGDGGGALTSRGAHTTHSMGPCELGRMHSPGAEHRRPREP